MPVNNIVNNGYAISFASPVDDSNDLLLWDKEDSLKVKNEYASIFEAVRLLQEAFLPEQNFFYKIECFDSLNPGRKLIYGERGVGEVSKKYRKFYLKREYTTHLEDEYGERKSSGCKVNFPKDSFIICTSYIPKHFLDLLIYPNSVIVSIDPGQPTPVELEEQTLLGRLDGRIQSIDSIELRTILGDKNIIDAVESTNKPFSLQSKVVDLVETDSRITAGILNARPRSNKPARPQRGSIVYNDQINRFEGYDGTAWRPLKWGDE